MASGNIPAHPWASCRPSRLGSATFLDDLAQTCTDEVDVDGSKKKDGERGWWEGVRVEVERSRCEAGDGSPPHSCTVGGTLVWSRYWEPGTKGTGTLCYRSRDPNFVLTSFC